MSNRSTDSAESTGGAERKRGMKRARAAPEASSAAEREEEEGGSQAGRGAVKKAASTYEVRFVTSKQYMPLFFAVRFGNTDLVHSVLRNPKADLNAQEKYTGFTALHSAIRNIVEKGHGHANALALLSHPGIDVNARTAKGLTVLGHAFQIADAAAFMAVFEAVMAAGRAPPERVGRLDVNARINAGGDTALVYAAARLSVESRWLAVVRSLLRVPDIEVNNLARMEGAADAIGAAGAAGAAANTPLGLAMQAHSFEAVHALLSVDALDVNAACMNGESALKYALGWVDHVVDVEDAPDPRWLAVVREIMYHKTFNPALGDSQAGRTQCEWALAAVRRNEALSREELRSLESDIRDVMQAYRGECVSCTKHKPLLLMYPCGHQKCCKTCYFAMHQQAVELAEQHAGDAEGEGGVGVMVACPMCRVEAQHVTLTSRHLFRGGVRTTPFSGGKAWALPLPLLRAHERKLSSMPFS
jgi:hypothetical protein